MKYRWAHYIFTAGQTPRSIYPSVFNHFWNIAIYRWWVIDFQQWMKWMSLFLPHFAFHWVRPWDNRIKFYMDGKRIQCWSYASQHVPIYLQPFTSYNEILVENCNFFLPLASNAPVWGVPIWIPGKSLDLRKLESWGYQAVKTVWR